MAEPCHIGVSPQNYNSTVVGLAATLHAAAEVPNFPIIEYCVSFEETGAAIARSPLRGEQGHIALPTAPASAWTSTRRPSRDNPYLEAALRQVRRPEDE